MPPLHRLGMVVTGHWGSCPSTSLKPQVERFLHLQEKCRRLRLKPRLQNLPTLPKPQQLSKELFRCRRPPSSATRQVPFLPGNSEQPTRPPRSTSSPGNLSHCATDPLKVGRHRISLSM